MSGLAPLDPTYLGVFGIGALALIIVQAFATGSSKAREYPPGEEMARQGWRIIGGPE